MKFSGEIFVKAPRDAVFDAMRDARFFASCVEGVREIEEISDTTYAAVLDTKVAYLRFQFRVTVEIVRIVVPTTIEAKMEGTPAGIVGRFAATSVTRLSEQDGGTLVNYDVDATLAGKLGSIGQPVLRAKAKEMERGFAEKLRSALEGARLGVAG